MPSPIVVHVILPCGPSAPFPLSTAEIGDTDNARALFERVFAEPDNAKSPLLWRRFVQFEYELGNIGAAQQVGGGLGPPIDGTILPLSDSIRLTPSSVCQPTTSCSPTTYTVTIHHCIDTLIHSHNIHTFISHFVVAGGVSCPSGPRG